MRTEVTSFEIESYQANGFVAIHDFLTDDEVTALAALIDKAAGPPSTVGLANIRGKNMSRSDPELAAFWRSEAVGKMVGELGRYSGTRHLSDGTSFVLQGHPATPWHCNMYEHWPVDTADAVCLWIPLDDLRWYNKGLVFLPGSHKLMPLGLRKLTPTLRNATFGSLLEEFPELRNIEPVTVEGRAGAGIFYNPIGIHGSAPNMTPRTRRQTSASYVPDGVVANGLPGDEGQGFGSKDTVALPAGTPLTDAQAPLIWKR